VLLDCSKKSIKLTTLNGKELEFVTKPVVIAKGVANRAKINQQDASQGSEVPVVNEFPDAFPEEMLDMPPNRDIKFVIELKPGTAAIYKTPFRMTTITPSFYTKTECLPLCVPRSGFTHKETNSEINSITSVYYIVSYLQNLLQV
jgi:hypothetical protein